MCVAMSLMIQYMLQELWLVLSNPGGSILFGAIMYMKTCEEFCVHLIGIYIKGKSYIN